MDNFTILATKILTEQTIQGNQQVTHRDTEDNESGIRSLKNWDVEVEDNQNTADPVAVAYDVNNRLADTAKKGLLGKVAGLAGTQAQEAKKLKKQYDSWCESRGVT